MTEPLTATLRQFCPRTTYWSVITLAGLVLLGAVACVAEAPAPELGFVPGESPTVTLLYDAAGTPSAPVAITPDLPEGWRWQYAGDLPNFSMRDAWFLIDHDSKMVLAIHNAGDDCWLVADPDSETSCRPKDEIGAYALEFAGQGN